MLTIPLEKLAFIIVKAREFDAETPGVDDGSGSNPTDDGQRNVLVDNGDNAAEEELTDAIEALNDSERTELLALIWLGRGDYDKEAWREALIEARRVHDDREIAYLVGTPLLADFLEEGLSQLGLSIADFEIGRM